jgi:hypothetical protein
MLVLPYVANYRERILSRKRLGFERKRSEVLREREEAENQDRRVTIEVY